MDDSDRIESQESAVAIPEHLVLAIEEWLEERIRQASDTYGRRGDACCRDRRRCVSTRPSGPGR
jgi:hypothetical protein